VFSFRNETEKNSFIKTIIPLFKLVCTQRPVKIDHHRLFQLKSHHGITLNQLAWLQSISEMNIYEIDSIIWENDKLCERVMEIQRCFHTILKNESLNNKSPKIAVSPTLAIRLLESIIIIDRVTESKEKAYAIERARLKLFKQNLANINLTTELIKGLRGLCGNAPVTLIPENIPQIIWLKYLAHYLAISSKRYSDYGDIDYDDEKLINNAIGIHKILRETLSDSLNIVLNERALMLPEHRMAADKAGITDIALVAIYPTRNISDDWSVEVTKELALILIKQLPEFNYLFKDTAHDSLKLTTNNPLKSIHNHVDNLTKSEQAVIELSLIANMPKPSQSCQDRTILLKQAIERLLEIELKLARPKSMWLYLCDKSSVPNYKIKEIRGSGTKKIVTFMCGHSFDYRAAYPHIQKGIEWFSLNK